MFDSVTIYPQERDKILFYLAKNQLQGICFIDTEGTITNIREITFLVCFLNKNNVLEVSAKTFDKDTRNATDIHTITTYLQKHNYLITGYNISHDLDILWNEYKVSFDNVIDIAELYQYKLKSKTIKLDDASFDMRDTTGYGKWERSAKHSSLEDCIETLYCFNHIMTTLDIQKYYIHHLVEHAGMGSNSAIPAETLEQKKRYLASMLKVLFNAKREQKSLTLKELFSLTQLNAEPNLREIFIPIKFLFATFNLTAMKLGLAQAEIDLLFYFADIFEKGTSKEEYANHLYLNNPTEQKKLRENFDKQFAMTKKQVNEWKLSYQKFMTERKKLRTNK